MNVVTGAFGFIGRAITQHLLERGEQVRTITTHPDKPNPFGASVEAHPYNFEHPAELQVSLQGAATLYNTYWIRFEYGGATFQQAVDNTITLFECARRAGVERIVHISVTKASLDCDLPYYRGKAQQEQALIDLGVPYAILRPTLVFGEGDILVNNMAWLLRRFPVFPIFGSGAYRLQPIYVGDLAELAIASSSGSLSITVDAAGVEAFTFEEFIRLLASRIRPGAKLVHLPPGVGIALGRAIGFGVKDVILTSTELQGLMEERLTSEQNPTGATRFSEWLGASYQTLGRSYASELDRHFRWKGEGEVAPAHHAILESHR